MELLGHFEEGEVFLWQTLTGDETWAHHYVPENKRQSMEYRRRGSSAPKKCKTKTPAGKVILNIFWDSEGVVLTDFLGKGATVNSELYNETPPQKKYHQEGGRN